MELPLSSIAVFEENRTRADLYSLWLTGLDVRVAVTPAGVDDVLDRRVAVAIVNQEFGDAVASSLVDHVRSRASLCRVIETRARSAMFPELDAETQLVEPVFEEELQDAVEPLVHRANYHFALAHYYQTTISLSSIEVTEGDVEVDEERVADLKERATELQQLIAGLTRQMTREDLEAVREAVSFDHDLGPVEQTEKVDSKYQPGDCSNCGAAWDPAGDDPQVTKLGAYVWRCLACGHVQLRADPSHQNVASL